MIFADCQRQQGSFVRQRVAVTEQLHSAGAGRIGPHEHIERKRLAGPYAFGGRKLYDGHAGGGGGGTGGD